MVRQPWNPVWNTVTTRGPIPLPLGRGARFGRRLPGVNSPVTGLGALHEKAEITKTLDKFTMNTSAREMPPRRNRGYTRVGGHR